jgi:dienelactone hydrolase
VSFLISNTANMTIGGAAMMVTVMLFAMAVGSSLASHLRNTVEVVEKDYSENGQGNIQEPSTTMTSTRRRSLMEQERNSMLFSCDLEMTHQRLGTREPLVTLDDLQQVLVHRGDSALPFTKQVTDVPGVAPYIYKGFHIRPIYFEGLPYHGKCTLVFAWLSTPVVNLEQDQVPQRMTAGTVLLHGGGQTANKDWVEHWAAKGYSSIAMGLEGQTSHANPEIQFGWHKTPFPGPERVGEYGDWQEEPLWNQWMFHAVSTSMLANTILRAQPTVNAQQVGVAGVSWGAVIATDMLRMDSRFAFAILAFGCASLTSHGAEGLIGSSIVGGGLDQRAFYEDVWDARSQLRHVTTPTLWMSSPTDPYFPLKAQAATYTALHPDAPIWVSNVPNLVHGHFAMYERPESYAFAKSVVDSAASTPGGRVQLFAQHVRQPLLDGDHNEDDSHMSLFIVTFQLLKPLMKASLVWSETPIEITPRSYDRVWHEETVDVRNQNFDSPASVIVRQVEQGSCHDEISVVDSMNGQSLTPCYWSVTVSIPLNTRGWYINVEMEQGLIVSSQYIERAAVTHDSASQ